MPELRRDPVVGRWVIIATERAKRPMDFIVPQHEDDGLAHECPFCEGREAETPAEIVAVRAASSVPNGPGWSVRVVPSVNPVLRIEGALNRRAKGMFDVMNGIGAHEVVVESPAHIENMADLSPEQIALAVRTSISRIGDLERDPRFRYALWFKNYGTIAGAGRVRHTRSQLIATPTTPKRVKEELAGARRYYEEKERCIFCDLIAQERQSKERLVIDSAHMVALCPFASRFPFELAIFPKRHACRVTSLSPEEMIDLSGLLKECLSRLKRILNDPSYNIVLHTAPFYQNRLKAGYWKTIEEDYHWYLELMPRLTRVAGFEWGSGFYINPTPPEEAAHFLRDAVAEVAPAPNV